MPDTLKLGYQAIGRLFVRSTADTSYLCSKKLFGISVCRLTSLILFVTNFVLRETLAIMLAAFLPNMLPSEIGNTSLAPDWIWRAKC
jgi:hypothetical protein